VLIWDAMIICLLLNNSLKFAMDLSVCISSLTDNDRSMVIKPVFLVASYPRCDHMPSIVEQFSVRTIRLDVLRAVSAPHN
jgi:hypothetical protein